jgi:membrane protein implicated in regulation of membrane protease activity
VPSPSQSDPLAELALTLAAHEAARLSLEASAPSASQSLGGAEAIMGRFGGEMRPHAGGWWAVNLDDATWSALCQDQQAPYRSGRDEC